MAEAKWPTGNQTLRRVEHTGLTSVPLQQMHICVIRSNKIRRNTRANNLQNEI
jgi:hypothetical protein